MNSFVVPTILLLTTLSWACPLTAGVIFFSPNMVQSTDESLHHEAVNTINQSGITSPVTLTNIGTIFHTDGGPDVLWRGDSDILPLTLTFDFISPTQIDYVGLWQGTDHSQGVRDFNLTFYDGAAGTGGQIGSLYSSVLDTGAGGFDSIPLYGRAFEVGRRSGVRSIEMQITSRAVEYNHYVHLGEFMVANVPEPSSFVILVCGAVVCGRKPLLRRFRKSK